MRNDDRRRGRPRGDRDFTREQFLAAYAAELVRLRERRRGRPTEEEIAAGIGIARSTLHRYRIEYDVPRDYFIQTSDTRRALVVVASRS